MLLFSLCQLKIYLRTYVEFLLLRAPAVRLSICAPQKQLPPHDSLQKHNFLWVGDMEVKYNIICGIIVVRKIAT